MKLLLFFLSGSKDSDCQCLLHHCHCLFSSNIQTIIVYYNSVIASLAKRFWLVTALSLLVYYSTVIACLLQNSGLLFSGYFVLLKYWLFCIAATSKLWFRWLGRPRVASHNAKCIVKTVGNVGRQQEC